MTDGDERPDDESSSTTDGSSTTSGGDDDMPKGAANGEPCAGPLACASGACYLLEPGNGTCGECDENSDCENSACSAIVELVDGNVQTTSTCQPGPVDALCRSDASCEDGLQCILSPTGLMNCGECETDDQCPGDMVCGFVPNGLGRTCIDPGTVPDGGLCAGPGAEECASGVCDVILGDLGGCVECVSDADCPGGTCTTPPLEEGLPFCE